MGIRLNDLSDQVTAGTFQGQELEVFTPSAQMLLSLLHHGGKDRFALLKQVNDIAMLMKNGEGYRLAVAGEGFAAVPCRTASLHSYKAGCICCRSRGAPRAGGPG